MKHSMNLTVFVGILIVLVPHALLSIVPTSVIGSSEKSKLTIHTGMLGSLSMPFIETAKPTVVKLLDNFDQARSIKQKVPGTLIVGRIYLPNQPTDGSPETRAQEWWNSCRDGILAYPNVDYWEGYNEPPVETVDQMRWYARFEVKRIQILAENGRKACIGSFSVGRPEIVQNGQRYGDIWRAFYPAIDEANAHGGVLGLHEYSAPSMQDGFDSASGEGWLTGRYRKVYNWFLIPDGKKIPLIVTECGIDGGVMGQHGKGWKSFTDTKSYMDQLKWYDNLLKANDYVLGATIFCLEIPDWENFDIAPLMPDLTAYVSGGATQGGLVTNLNVASGKRYELAYLREGDQYYIDRKYTLADIPDSLERLLWIKTANDDKNDGSGNFLSFDVSQAVTIYVGYDQRATSLPNWLSSWTPLPDIIRVNGDSMGYFKVYRKDLSDRHISLGGNKASGAKSMYVVIVSERVSEFNDAEFISQSVPTTMVAGQRYEVRITMRNKGTTTWKANMEYKLGSQNPQDNQIWGTGRVLLSQEESIAPGQEKVFAFTVTAPSEPGDYNFQWKMLREYVEWFGAYTPNIQVRVNALVTISGRVTSSANGGPIPGIWVYFWRHDGYSFYVRTDSDGRFSVQVERSSDESKWYNIHANKENNDPAHPKNPDYNDIVKNNIVPDQDRTVDFQLTSPTSLVTNLWVASGRAYELAYLKVGDKYYIDRTYVINQIPDELGGALWIKTANEDKNRGDSTFLRFDVTKNSRVYVGYDRRASSLPSWLSGWTYLTSDLKVSDSSMGYFKVYFKEFSVGQRVELGGNVASGASGAKSMYVVLVKEGSSSPRPTTIHSRVFLLIFNPVIESEGGRRLSQVCGWNDPDRLAQQYIDDVRYSSWALVQYDIVSRIEADEFPVKADGFRYTDETYMECYRTWSGWHQPDSVDYNAIINNYNIVQMVESGTADEVWLFGMPYSGFWESTMAGNGAYWCNSPPVKNIFCSKKFILMGFNYERGVDCMLEDLGHRAESIMTHVYGSWVANEDHAWNRFTLYDKVAPGRAACGNVHYAPNSLSNYDWGNTRYVWSTCDDWYSYPNLTGAKRQVNCQEWGGGDMRAHHIWWFRHIPRAEGTSDGYLNNWWKYIIKYYNYP